MWQYHFSRGLAEKTGDPMHEFPGCTLVADSVSPGKPWLVRITSADPNNPPACKPNFCPTNATRTRSSRACASRRGSSATLCDAALGHAESDRLSLAESTSTCSITGPTAGTTFHQTKHVMMGPGPMAVVVPACAYKAHRSARDDAAASCPDGGFRQPQRHVIMIRGKGCRFILTSA